MLHVGNLEGNLRVGDKVKCFIDEVLIALKIITYMSYL